MENNLQITMRLKDEATEQIKKAVGNVNQAFGEAQKSSNLFSQALADVGKIATGIGLYKLVDTVISYTKETIKAGIETSKFYENARIGLTTLLGDAGKASKLLTDIQKTAMATPFDASALVKANQLLIAAGENADKAQKVVLDLGNAILATGGGNDELMRMAVNLQQIKNIGKATALDIKQFAFAGIPVYKMLADSMGTTVEKVKDMEISYDMLANAFAKARQEGGMFYKGMENAAGSLTQIQSNFKETINTTIASILEQSGAIDLLKNALSGATNFLIAHKNEILGTVSSIRSWIEQNQTLITGIMIFIGVLGGLAITFGIIVGLITSITRLFSLLMPLFSLLTPQIILIGVAIAILITIFILFKDQIITILNDIYIFITNIFNQIWSVISYVLNTIFSLFQFIFFSIKSLIENIMTTIYGFILTIMNSIKGVVNSILTAIFGDFNSKFNQIKNTIVTIFTQAYDWFKSKLDSFSDMVDSITSKVLGFFKRMADGITAALRSIKFPHLSIGEGSITIMGKEIKYPKLNVDWYEKGGWVRNTGLAVVHAGEYVLSRDMLAGRQPIGAPIYNYSNSYAPVVNAVINTPIDLDYLAYKLSWQLRNG